LHNVVERAGILSTGTTLQLDDRFDTGAANARAAAAAAPPPCRLEDVERAHILAVLETCDWKIRGRNQAAEQLGLHPSTLYSRLQKLGIRRTV